VIDNRQIIGNSNSSSNAIGNSNSKIKNTCMLGGDDKNGSNGSQSFSPRRTLVL
jgi:hypothetical protein